MKHLLTMSAFLTAVVLPMPAVGAECTDKRRSFHRPERDGQETELEQSAQCRRWVAFVGCIENGEVAGNFMFQFAQAAASVENSVALKRSHIEISSR